MVTDLKISRRSFYEVLLAGIIFVPLIIDFLTGVFQYTGIDIPVGRLYRGLIWFVGMVYLIQIRRFGFLGIFLVLWVFHVILWKQFNEELNLGYEFSFLLKASYFFVIYFILKNLVIPNKGEMIGKFLRWYFKLVIALYWFSFITGVGRRTYGDWGFGTRSFFEAQIDIGITILVLLILFLFNKKTFHINWIWLLLGYGTLIIMGTTTGMIISTIILITYALIQFFLSKMRPYKKIILGSLITVVIVVGSMGVYRLVSTTPFFISKYEQILERGVRAEVTEWAQDYFEDRSWPQSVFGEGVSVFSKNFASYAQGSKRERFEEQGAFVERDYHDIKGAFGLILLALMILYYGYLLFKSLYYLNKDLNMFFLSILLILIITYLHGFLAGHVFYSPTVGGVLAAVIALNTPSIYSELRYEG